MEEIKYRGAETLNYSMADFSNLKYIKINYTDINNESHELKTEINFLGDSFISIFVQNDKTKIVENDSNKVKNREHDSETTEIVSTFREDYLKKLSEIKAAKEMIGKNGELDEYNKKLAELKQMQILSQEAEQTGGEKKLSEEEIKKCKEKEMEKYKADCPQTVLLKFVVGELLYVTNAELKSIKMKYSKIYFNISAPDTLKLQQLRRFYRINLKRLCILIGSDKEGSTDTYVSRSINLSAGGVLINRLESVTESKYITLNPEKYEKFNLVIVLEMDKILKLPARYVRQEEGKSSQRYAFEFVDISEEKTNYISKYVIRKQIDELSEEFCIKNKQVVQRMKK